MYPIVFLYRHSFELALKNILLKPALLIAFKGITELESKLYPVHDLTKLSNHAATMLRGLFPDDDQMEERVTKTMLDVAAAFAAIDPDSFAYRYPVNKKGGHSTAKNQTVSLELFHTTMSLLLRDLEVIDFGIDIETDLAQNAYEIMVRDL